MDEEEMSDRGGLRERVWRVIFEAETPMGKAFDVILMVLILASVVVVSLETVAPIEASYGQLLLGLEWAFTIIFTIEYLVRLWVVRRPLKYAKSFFGIVDLLSCLPLYLSLFIPGAKSLFVVRVLRLLRIFRVLKMMRHVRGAQVLLRALYSARAKITVFFFCVVVFTVLAGAVMYFVEHEANPDFSSIPMSVYWAIVTVSTVGFGDITPVTPLGQVIASVSILIGYAIIAVPTGIVSSELMVSRGNESTDACRSCGAHGHLDDAVYCRKCGEKLD